MNKEIKKYLDNLPSPQKEICEKVRKIILTEFPDLEESMKNGVPSYENKYYIVGLKDHVNIGFFIEGLSAEEIGLFEGKGKLTRHIKIYSLDEIDEKKIVKLLKIII
ncbi:MAG: DUF1801 domain-containing protein [Gammaproteobacteria bacterium]|nr:DUF1801 domain-containing protein [Gammaproteobacteria bacterium]